MTAGNCISGPRFKSLIFAGFPEVTASWFSE